jgi:large subunit GTPase 1
MLEAERQESSEIKDEQIEEESEEESDEESEEEEDEKADVEKEADKPPDVADVTERLSNVELPVESNIESTQSDSGASNTERQLSEKSEAKSSAELLDAESLILLFKTLFHGTNYTPGVTTVGLVISFQFQSFHFYKRTILWQVGYPNVGKSSTINAILKAKKVAVSATPGKTKHFQVRNYCFLAAGKTLISSCRPCLLIRTSCSVTVLA